MESEKAWQDMERMLTQEKLWLPGFAREEVREALGHLYRTGDPVWLAPYLRGSGGGDFCNVTMASEEKQSDTRLHETGGAFVVSYVTDFHNSIKEVLAGPKKDCHEEIKSHHSSHRKFVNSEQKKYHNNPTSLKRTQKVSSAQDPKLSICDICGYKPNKISPAAMRIHKDAIHFGIRYNCPQCNFPCTTKSNLKKHIAIRHEITIFQCSSCSYSAKSSNSLKNHNQIKHLGCLLLCKTVQCDFSTDQRQILKKHNISEHGARITGKVLNKKKKKVKFYKCSTRYSTTCTTVCESKLEIKQHYKIIHKKYNMIDSCYGCLECDFKTKDKTRFSEHILRNHSQLAQTMQVESDIQHKDLVQVNNDDLTSTNIKDFKQGNEETHENETSKAINAICEHTKCPDCGKSFTESPGLVEHFTRNCGCLLATNDKLQPITGLITLDI